MAGDYPAGGSLQLASLIDRHGDLVYSDLLMYAGGLNLFSMLEEGSGFSPRQILVLVDLLPLECKTKAALRGGLHFEGWGPDRYMTANLIDAVRENTYVTLLGIPTKSRKRPPAPEPTYRPEKAERAKKPNMFRMMAAKHIASVREKRSKGV